MVPKNIVMKNHKYDPELIRAICEDPEYFILFFNRLSLIRKDKLFTPKLRKSGDYTIKCCIHKEDTPSLRWNAKTKIFKCFGCGFAGNFLTLLKKFNDISFLETVAAALQMKKHPDKFPIFYNPRQLKFEFPPDTTSYRFFDEQGNPNIDDCPF